MKNIFFVTRADDAASSKSANIAIAKTIKRSFIKNVSIMAPGEHLDHAADLFSKKREVCFGMHGTLNAEWDKVKWKPVSAMPDGNGLTDENGYFHNDPEVFLKTKPQPELVIKEYAAQLDKLTKAGFKIAYVDSHMFPEMCIPGMDEAVCDFAKQKGLLDHMYYYVLPPGFLEAANNGNLTKVLKNIPDGQYFYVAHPAKYSEEMLKTGNSRVSGNEIAKNRSSEAKFLSSVFINSGARLMGIQPLRYDEAKPLDKRLTVEDVRKLLG